MRDDEGAGPSAALIPAVAVVALVGLSFGRPWPRPGGGGEGEIAAIVDTILAAEHLMGRLV